MTSVMPPAAGQFGIELKQLGTGDRARQTSDDPLAVTTSQTSASQHSADDDHAIPAGLHDADRTSESTHEARGKSDHVVVKINQDKQHQSAGEQANGYLRFLARLRQHWTDCPDVHIQWQNLSYILHVPVKDKGIRNFLQTGWDALKRLNCLMKRKTTTFNALAPSSGCILPGTMTLILCPPGHGKSTLLRALAGRLHKHNALHGDVLYNGLTPAQARARGVYVSRLLAYVGQGDIHFPVLTTRETLEFAAHNSVPDVALLTTSDAELLEMERRRAELMINLLGLDECADTIIGNDLLRGVSGGQRRRVTLGEMLITNARVLLLDEVSTGLDAAVTYHIFKTLRQWTQLCRSSIVTALLQPTPEVYELFDDVILMRDGEVVYHGPRTGVKDFFANHLHCTIPDEDEESGFVVDYLVDPKAAVAAMEKRRKQAADNGAVLAESKAFPPPEVQAQLAQSATKPQQPHVVGHTSFKATRSFDEAAAEQLATAAPGASAASSTTPAGYAPAHASTKVLVDAYRSSPYYALQNARLASSLAACREQNHTETGKSATAGDDGVHVPQKGGAAAAAAAAAHPLALDPTRWSDYTRRQFARPYPHSPWRYTQLDMVRQGKLSMRAKQVFVPRIIQAVLMGIIFATLYFQLSTEDYQSRFGLALYCVLFGAFANLSELPLAAEARNVVTKQVDAGFYPTVPFVVSNVIWSIPRILLEALLFGTLMYWIPAFVPHAGNFFFFIFILTLSSMALSTFFRTISFIAANPDVARQMDFPFIIIFVIFGGFLIPYGKIPNWLIWCYWLNPLQWACSALGLNEFRSSRYDTPVTTSDGRVITTGESYLEAFSFPTDLAYQYGAIAYLIGFFLCFAATSAIALQRVRATAALGTKRMAAPSDKAKDDHDGEHTPPVAAQGGAAQLAVRTVQAPAFPLGKAMSATPEEIIRASESSMPNMGAMPFTPVTLVWRNITYTVMVTPTNKKGTPYPRVLLRNISGYARPGSMTALMGSSGAGKTTLMDVVAFRKTMGTIEGDVLVNGQRVGDGPDCLPRSTFNRLTGYVEQQDLHMGLTTVREALEFSARIRLPATVKTEDRDKWVREVMNLVGLTRIANRLVGDAANPGLSPGQLKLLTIGVELVANPSIIFLDEPTSGLDAPSAARVMKAVKRIANTGRSILCTIHQPSAELFCMFDRLLLLRSGGEEVYFSDLGPHAGQLVQYFETVSAGKAPKLPYGQNPANWMLDIIGAGVASAEGGTIQASGFEYQDYTAIWRAHPLHTEAMQQLQFAASSSPVWIDMSKRAQAQPYVGTPMRFWLVLHRYFVMHWRNAPTNLTRVTLLLIIGLLLGIIYLQINVNDTQGVHSMLSAIFLGLAFPSGMAAASAFPSLFRQRAVYYRESTVGMYDYKIFSLTLFIVELPYIFFCLAAFIFPFYFMVGLRNDGNLFFKYYLVVFLMATTYSSLSQLWMALAPTQILSNVLNSFFLSMFFMFGGVFRAPHAIPPGWKWFYYLGPIGKALIAAVGPQFDCTPSPTHICPTIDITENGTTTTRVVSEYVAETVGGSAADYGMWIGYLILTIGVLRLLILLALKKISHIKR